AIETFASERAANMIKLNQRPVLPGIEPILLFNGLGQMPVEYLKLVINACIMKLPTLQLPKSLSSLFASSSSSSSSSSLPATPTLEAAASSLSSSSSSTSSSSSSSSTSSAFSSLSSSSSS